MKQLEEEEEEAVVDDYMDLSSEYPFSLVLLSDITGRNKLIEDGQQSTAPGSNI